LRLALSLDCVEGRSVEAVSAPLTRPAGAPALEVLSCPSCGADLPLGDGDQVRCSHCGATVPVSAAYQELRAAARASDDDRKRAEALLRRLDKPPQYWTRLLAAMFDQPMLLFFLLFGVPIGVFAAVTASEATDLLVLATHSDPNSTLFSELPFVFALGVVFVFAFVPRAIGVYAARRNTARAMLLATLTAKPPGPEGGATRCRVCGAPLDVPPGAIVARCDYCHADNAVVVQTPLLLKEQAAVAKTHQSIAQAAAVDAAERASTRRKLWHELGRYTLWFAVFGALFGVYAWDDARPDVQAGDAHPEIGNVAVAVAGILLIVLAILSVARSGENESAQRRTRLQAAGIPRWTAILAPFSLWVVLYFARLVLAVILGVVLIAMKHHS
jgi:LSD1 subclass zinc finger protein